MKKYFDVIETVTYSHRIVVEINESQEDEFEGFADVTADEVMDGAFDCTEEIVNCFTNAFGEESVEFIEDGSPRVEYEAY